MTGLLVREKSSPDWTEMCRFCGVLLACGDVPRNLGYAVQSSLQVRISRLAREKFESVLFARCSRNTKQNIQCLVLDRLRS